MKRPLMLFRVFPCAADKTPLIKDWQRQATNDKLQLANWHKQFAGVLAYWGVPTGRVNDLLVLDVDVKNVNGFDSLKAFPMPTTMTQQTRTGGMHFLFRYPKDGRHYGNKVNFRPGLDTRGEGGYIIFYSVDKTLTLADAPQWLIDAAVKREETVQGTPVKICEAIAKGVIECSLEAVREAPEGESNNVLNIQSFKVGQLVASGAITREHAETELLKAAVERGKPIYEAKATIASGLDGGVKKPLTSPFGDTPPVSLIEIPPPPALPARWTPQFFTREDLLNTSKLRKPQLFQDWSTEDIHITTADGGTGKTTAKLHEAVCLALGDRFLGFNCLQRGKTLFITGEDTSHKLAAMVGKIAEQMGLLEPGSHNADKIQCLLRSIAIKKDSDLCLIVKDKNTGFLNPNPDATRKLMEAIEDIQPKLIVFDPISSFWGSEAALNDMAKAVAKFMQHIAEQSHACVEIINHMGKASSSNKDLTQFAGRGGTGLPSHARVSRVFHSLSEEEYTDKTNEVLEDGQSAILCAVNKFSDGSPLYNKPFVMIRNGFLFSRQTLSKAKLQEAEKALSTKERVFTFIKEVREKNMFPSKNLVLSHFRSISEPPTETSVKHALELLQYEGHLGERTKMIENPDVTAGGKVFVITDFDGKEV